MNANVAPLSQALTAARDDLTKAAFALPGNPADIAAKVVETIDRHGLDCWVYTDRDWLVRKTDAPHVAREQWTVKFPPKVVPDFGAAHAREERFGVVREHASAVAVSLLMVDAV